MVRFVTHRGTIAATRVRCCVGTRSAGSLRLSSMVVVAPVDFKLLPRHMHRVMLFVYDSPPPPTFVCLALLSPPVNLCIRRAAINKLFVNVRRITHENTVIPEERISDVVISSCIRHVTFESTHVLLAPSNFSPLNLIVLFWFLPL